MRRALTWVGWCGERNTQAGAPAAAAQGSTAAHQDADVAKPPEHALFECALAELLAAGVADDVGPQLQEFLAEPAALAQAFARLPPSVQEQLGCTLPVFDVARSDRLRNAQRSEALREVAKSLDEVATPAALQRRRDGAWTPAVGDACEARYKAGEDGPSRRTVWFSGKIVDVGDEEDGVKRRFCVRARRQVASSSPSSSPAARERET